MKEMINELPAGGASPDITCHLFSNGEWLPVPSSVPRELSLTLYLNEQILITILCTPVDLINLVVGFLYAEEIINNTSEIADIIIDDKEGSARIRLNKEYTVPSHQTRTATGITFGPKVPAVYSDITATPEELLSLMKEMLRQQKLYEQCGGTHGSALCDRERLLVKAEDIGRHNTLDRILGECLLKKISIKDHILVTTGRISSEMLLKAARMQTPIVVSRSSPTERAVQLGRESGVTVVGYALDNSLSVFSCADRVHPDIVHQH